MPDRVDRERVDLSGLPQHFLAAQGYKDRGVTAYLEQKATMSEGPAPISPISLKAADLTALRTGLEAVKGGFRDSFTVGEDGPVVTAETVDEHLSRLAEFVGATCPGLAVEDGLLDHLSARGAMN